MILFLILLKKLKVKKKLSVPRILIFSFVTILDNEHHLGWCQFVGPDYKTLSRSRKSLSNSSNSHLGYFCIVPTLSILRKTSRRTNWWKLYQQANIRGLRPWLLKLYVKNLKTCRIKHPGSEKGWKDIDRVQHWKDFSHVAEIIWKEIIIKYYSNLLTSHFGEKSLKLVVEKY